MQGINHLLVKTDQFCDQVPFVSSITNLVDLFQKCVVLPFINEETIASNHYWKHINEKSYVRCFVLIVPVIGNIFIGIFYEVGFRKQTKSCLQDGSLEEISKMTAEKMEELCKTLKVNNREDYIKGMLIYAINAENLKSDVDWEFHKMIHHLQKKEIGLKEFVYEDIAAGRNNEENTLLHEILKCKFLSLQTKGEAFNFILRDGHDLLREYFGEKTFEKKNEWGIRPPKFSVVKWGDSLKKIFDAFSVKEQEEFFGKVTHKAIVRLEEFTGIVKVTN